MSNSRDAQNEANGSAHHVTGKDISAGILAGMVAMLIYYLFLLHHSKLNSQKYYDVHSAFPNAEVLEVDECADGPITVKVPQRWVVVKDEGSKKTYIMPSFADDWGLIILPRMSMSGREGDPVDVARSLVNSLEEWNIISVERAELASPDSVGKCRVYIWKRGVGGIVDFYLTGDDAYPVLAYSETDRFEGSEMFLTDMINGVSFAGYPPSSPEAQLSNSSEL